MMHNPTYDDLVNAAEDGLVVLAVKTRVMGAIADSGLDYHQRRVTNGTVFYPRVGFLNGNGLERAIHHIRACAKLHREPNTWHYSDD